MQLIYTLNPRKIALALSILAIYFAVQSLITEYLTENILDADTHYILILALDVFSVNAEETIPTWYATLLLFIAAALLSVITAAKYSRQDPFRRYWVGLAVLFLYLSIDEGAAIHEILSDVMETVFEPTGYLYFAWLVVAVPLVILFAGLYLRFLLHLPLRTRNLMILAGILYVGGAVIVEAISANRWYLDGGPTFEYLAIATIEECAEMIGVIVLIYALLAYSVEMRYTVLLNLRHPTVSNATTETPQLEPAHKEEPNLRLWRPLTVFLLFILGANILLVYWAHDQAFPSITSQPDTRTNSEAIIDQLAAYDVRITHLEGRFGFENIASRQITAGLFTEFDEVMIVTWAAADSSIALAADELPFDRNRLSEVLYASGETQFVIYETVAVRAIVGDIQPVRAD